MKSKLTLFIVSLTFALLYLTTFTFAQGTGIISGRVTDSNSGDYLPGANILLEGTTIGAATDLKGNYRIVNIPAGTYILKARYIGYKDYSEKVTVTAGRNISYDIKLIVNYIQTKEVVVHGLRQGQVKALAIQKEAPNIMNVVAREQMENFPDVNTAEILQRLPGVSIQRSQGNGRYVLIRGTSPRLSSVTVNGVALASTRNEERYSQLDIIGSNQMSFIEVAKTLTPDMDANSIGGTVNIITRSAFDFPGTHLDMTAGSGYSNLDKAPNWQWKFNYSGKFGTKKNFGFSLTANYDRSLRGADDIEYEWENKKDISNNKIPYALTDLTLFDYQLIKQRYGIGGSLEYKFDENNRIFVNGMWSKFKDVSKNNRLRFRVSKGNYLNPNGTLIEKARALRIIKGRTENLFQNNFTFGGKHLFGNNKLDFLFSYSYGEENHPNQTDAEFDLNSKINMSLDFTNPVTPKWTITNQAPEYINTASNYEFSSIDSRVTFSSTINRTAALNFKKPYNFFGNASNFKIGVKYTSLSKQRGDERAKYKWKGSNNLFMSNWLSNRTRDNFFNDNYRFGDEADWNKIKAFFDSNRDQAGKLIGSPNLEDSQGASYQIGERAFAYYAMTDINFGKIYLIGGFRQEFTTDNLDGNQLIFNASGDFSSLKPTTLSKNYNKVFPMVQVKYSLSPSSDIRLAATRSMSRPNFFDLAPHTFIDNRKERIKSGNPDLVPTTSINLDLMGSHYFQSIGIVSAGFFYKDLKDIIFDTRTHLTSGEFAGYELRTTVNGGNANLYGFELTWQQELSFLPGFLSGFGIYSNYTHTWSNANLQGREGVIPGQSGDIGNLSLSYEMSRFSARLSFAYQGKFINKVGGSENDDEWIKAHGQLDFTTQYKFIDHLNLFLEVVNITNEPKYKYLGIETRPVQVEYYSWWARVGFKYVL